MHAADLLRVNFQSHRQLAIHADKGFTTTLQAAGGVASDIYSGIERASWYASCLIPRYNDVCQQLKSEEIRTAYSIMSIFRYRDVIAHMLYLYFQTLCEDIKEGNINGSAQQLIRRTTGLMAHMTAAGGTRFAIAAAMAEAIAQSAFLKKSVAQKLAGKMPVGTYLLQIYGIQHKVAMAARKLKATAPNYYWLLYQAKLEMLYYFIEPALSEFIQKTNAGIYTNLDQLADEIGERFNV